MVDVSQRQRCRPAAYRVGIDYEEPKSAELQPLYHMLIRRHALPKVKEIFSPLRLPVDVRVRNVECGVSNAWYQRPVVTICYEYARDILKMAPQETSPDGNHAGGRGSRAISVYGSA